MKMAAGWSIVTKENTNFARLSKLLIDGGTHVLRAIFDKIHPPCDLKRHLRDSTNHDILKNLKSKKLLRPEQWSRLYPSVEDATSKGFDITLLNLLLRNICNLPTPANGWDKEPAATSISQVDDIVRVKLYRNKLCHISEPALSDSDFDKYWDNIKTILIRLGEDKAAIDHLRMQSMDPEDEKYYIECLDEWSKSEERVVIAVEETRKILIQLHQDTHQKLDEKNTSRRRSRKRDVKSYLANLKEAIIKQTDMQPKVVMNESVKTDDIFTNLIVHYGNKRRAEQIQRPQEDHSEDHSRKTLNDMKQCSNIFVGEEEQDSTIMRYLRKKKGTQHREENPKRIIVSGEPGVGKSFFSLKLVRDLATNSISIPNINFIYRIAFRQLNQLDKYLSLQDLLNLSPLLNEVTMIKDPIMEYITNHPNQLFVVLDGLDEYDHQDKILGDFESRFANDVKTKMPVPALISKLVRKTILRDSVILITSRPGETSDLDREIHFDRYVEITGFSEAQVIAYVEKYFKSKPEKVKKMAIDKVNGATHANRISIARVPLRCWLMCVLIEREIQNNLDYLCPGTLTKFYIDIIRCIERYYNKEVIKLDEKDASLAVDKNLEMFSLIAQHLTQQNRFSFTFEYLGEKLGITEKEFLQIKSSNLIVCCPVFSNLRLEKPTYEYSFTHVTIQEFFVASYLVEKKTMEVQNSSETVCVFMSGLLGLADNTDELMLELLECLGKKYGKRDKRQRVMYLRCLHEYGEEKKITREELTINRDYRYWNSVGSVLLHDITDTDCAPVAMLASNAATASSPLLELHIGLSSITCSGLNTLLPSLTNITELGLRQCQLDDECANCLSQSLSKTKIKVLRLPYNEITDIGVKCILTSIHATVINKLYLAGNPVSERCKKGSEQFCKKNPGFMISYVEYFEST